jgi:hypothetical protein
MTISRDLRIREIPAKTSPSIPGPPRGRQRLNVAELAKALEAEVEGEVRFDRGSLALYANDASNFRRVPIGVVIPRTLDDVVATHRVCAEFGAPVLSRGGGTSLSGETVNYAVVIDHSKYLTNIGAIDVAAKTVRCENGVINEDLNRRTGEHGLVFGPDPSSHSRCGLAGSWGFEDGKLDISMACGEQALLPAVRAADDETLVVANGFSCQTQIGDAGTGRAALHAGQVLTGASGRAPSRPRPPRIRRLVRTAGPILAVLTGGLAGARALRR